MSTGLLSLDYDRIISQWGDSSMFACDGSADELGDLLQQLEDDTCDTQAWLDCETSSTTRPASVPQQPQRMMAQQQVVKQDAQQHHPRPAPVTPFMAAHQASKVQQQQQQPQRSQQSSEGVVPSHSARAPAWWVDPAMSDMGTAAFGKEDQACRAAFDAFGNAFSPQLSAGRQNSSEPCIVPDTSVPPAPPLAHNSYGLVPQVLPPSPVSYMCMPPMPMAMPPMMPMPAAAAALLQPQATHVTAMSEQANDMLRLRQECLKRYRDKKARRMYTKMVRYQLRKINADKRPRIKGRFVKKTEEELAAAAGGSLPPTPKGAASKDGSSESTTVIDECLSDSSL